MPKGQYERKTKHCGGCGRDLPVRRFGLNRSTSTGLNSKCRDCWNRYTRARRQNKRVAEWVEPKRMPEKYNARTADAFELFFNEVTGLTLSAHGKRWVAAALKHRWLVLNVPPRHAKTTILAIWFVIWLFARDFPNGRNTQVLVVSKTASHGQKIARKIAFELEYNLKLFKLAGCFKPRDGDRPWAVGDGMLEIAGKDLSIRSGDLSLLIRGSGQQVLGLEADYIVADDITDRKIASSPTEKLKEWEWFLGDVLTRRSPDASVVCIGQRVHSDDIYGRLAQERVGDRLVWDTIVTPALDKMGRALWPEVWSAEALGEQRESMGEALFNCMYQQAPHIAGSFIREWWVRGSETEPGSGCLDIDRPLGVGWKGNDMVPIVRVLSVDPSPTMYAGIIVADVVYQQGAEEFWCSIVDARRGKMGQRVMLDEIEDLYAEYLPSAIVFESNSIKWLKEDVAWNRILRLFKNQVEHRTTAVSKGDKELGAWSLAADFEAGRIRFPYGDEDGREVSELIISEALAYPDGRTDDLFDALWFIKYKYRTFIPSEVYERSGFDRVPARSSFEVEPGVGRRSWGDMSRGRWAS